MRPRKTAAPTNFARVLRHIVATVWLIMSTTVSALVCLVGTVELSKNSQRRTLSTVKRTVNQFTSMGELPGGTKPKRDEAMLVMFHPLTGTVNEYYLGML
jgi:hypothetical protein